MKKALVLNGPPLTPVLCEIHNQAETEVRKATLKAHWLTEEEVKKRCWVIEMQANASYDLIWDHTFARLVVDTIGWDAFVAALDRLYDRGFYSCSQDWLNESKYICKLKGSRGDLVIGWKGIHNVNVNVHVN